MKIDMYREVPNKFHETLADTLNNLQEDTKQPALTGKEAAVRKPGRRFSPRRAAVLAAAVVLAFGTMTVGAFRLFVWHEQAEEHFGIEGELEEKLTAQGVAVEEGTVNCEGEIILEAIQSVRTTGCYYFLLRVTVPEGIAIDGDTLFDFAGIQSDKEFNGVTANIVTDSIDGNSFLCEITLLTVEGVDYDGETVVLTLKNLIQTEKTMQVGEPLVEGKWELALTLTAQEPGVREYYVESLMQWGENHKVMLYSVEADSFGVRLIVDKEQARHASQYHPLVLSSVEYNDGTVAEEGLTFRATDTTEDGDKLIFSVSFEGVGRAIDVDKLMNIRIDDGGECISLSAAAGSTVSGKANDNEPEQRIEEGAAWEENQEAFTALYAGKGYALLTDGSQLYLWDIACGKVEDSLDLGKIGYEPGSGEILAGVNGSMVYIIPSENSSYMYLYLFEQNAEGEPVLIERPAEELSEEMKSVYRGYQTDIEELLK